MADFQKFFPTLLRFEGGYSDDRFDPGGATNMGITFPVFRKYAPTLLETRPTLEGLRDLSKAQAAKIYKIEYWDATFGDDIAFQPLADILFDFYVNAGHHAIVLLFQVLNSRGGHFDVRTTLHAAVIDSLQHHDILQIYAEYREGRKGYYRTLVHQHPVLRRYLKGWLRRVDSFPDFEGKAKDCDA
ncbi:MAG: glycosyl hydrolase 108 family protein [Pseudomonadota bacterium]